MKYAKLGKLEKQIVLVENEETKHEEDYQVDSNRQAIEIRKADHRARKTNERSNSARREAFKEQQAAN